jgi:hypothetical protein
VIASLTTLIEFKTSIAFIFFLAIVFSFIGDLFMAEYIKLHKKRLINGALAFGIAHLFYIFAVLDFSTYNMILWIVATIIAIIAFFIIIYDPTEKISLLSISMFLYIFLLSVFILLATFNLFSGLDWQLKLISSLGIILFVISDAIIGLTEFRKGLNIPASSDLISITYVLAQILLQFIPVVLLS